MLIYFALLYLKKETESKEAIQHKRERERGKMSKLHYYCIMREIRAETGFRDARTRHCVRSLIRLYPRKLARTHKARARAKLNQIRSAKRSSLGSAFRARKRDSAATFPITLPYVAPPRGVTRPTLCRIYTRVAEIPTCRTRAKGGGGRRGEGDGGTLTLAESGSRYT